VTDGGAKLIEALRQAVAGEFGAVTINGQTWRPDEPWLPIETAPLDVPVLLYSPRGKLSHDPTQEADIRVARVPQWAWATHWMPLPEPPEGR
jgi:hypothetical protein